MYARGTGLKVTMSKTLKFQSEGDPTGGRQLGKAYRSNNMGDGPSPDEFGNSGEYKQSFDDKNSKALQFQSEGDSTGGRQLGKAYRSNNMGDGPSGEYKQSFDDKNRIAVVGMAVKYAGAPNVQQFWETLKEQKRGVRKIDAKRLNTTNKALHHASARSKYADSFVSDVYGVLDDVDSEHDLLLQLASDAIADAKTGAGSPLKGMARCGIVSGCLSFPRDETQKKLMPIYTAHVERELGHLPELAGNQGSRWTADGSQSGERPDLVDPASYVASKLGLKGGTPRYCVDAACASALYVLKLASDHLNSGTCVCACACACVCVCVCVFVCICVYLCL